MSVDFHGSYTVAVTPFTEGHQEVDIDALKVVAEGVNQLRAPNRSTVIVTHYQRLLDYIVPDYVHVLIHGRIVRSGGKELALKLEEQGYDWIREEVAEQTVGA